MFETNKAENIVLISHPRTDHRKTSTSSHWFPVLSTSTLDTIQYAFFKSSSGVHVMTIIIQRQCTFMFEGAFNSKTPLPNVQHVNTAFAGFKVDVDRLFFATGLST